MKPVVALLLAFMLLIVVGCSAPAAKPADTGAAATESPAAEPAKADPYAAIPTDGVHEKAALEALPAALTGVDASVKAAKATPTDRTGTTPTLFGYTLNVVADSQVTLFEVRADGKAYGLYAYPKSPDPADLYWISAEYNEGAILTAPEGARETAAVAAVKAVVDQAPSGTNAAITISGYMFAFIKDGQPVKTEGGQPFTVMLDPAGNAGSWSQ